MADGGERRHPVRGSHFNDSGDFGQTLAKVDSVGSSTRIRRDRLRSMHLIDHAAQLPSRVIRHFAYAVLPLLAACAAGGGAGPGSVGPALDAQAVAAAASVANRIPETAQLNFEWSLREPNLNVHGEGVVRVQPPARARVDLFLGEGTSVLAVALVGDDLRVPRGAPRGVIPSAPLLWATFGIFRPGDASVILGAEQVGERVRLRYRLPDSNEIHYYLVEHRVVRVEMYVDDELVHEVDLDVPDPTQLATESIYRNNPSFRELKVSVSTVEKMNGFPERIWSPGR